jgi:hypothetical protein
LVEFFYGAEGDDLGAAGVVFGASGEDFDVGQFKSADGFAEECGLFLVGVDHGQAQIGIPDFNGQAREAGARADVDQVFSG